MTPLLAAGIELMLVGMGTVFVFLTLLVLATHGMSFLVLRFSPPEIASVEVESAKASPAVDEEEVAAISIALAEHLRKTRRP